MNVNVQMLNFSVKEDLLTFAERKLSKLNHFYDRILSADVKFEELPVGERDKSVEVILEIPGNDVVVKKVAPSFEEALDDSVKVLERQLKKRKQKQKTFN